MSNPDCSGITQGRHGMEGAGLAANPLQMQPKLMLQRKPKGKPRGPGRPCSAAVRCGSAGSGCSAGDSEWEAVRQRHHLRWQAKTCAFIRLVMERAGIDPAGSRPFRDIEAGVLEFRDTPVLRARDGEFTATRKSDRPALIRG